MFTISFSYILVGIRSPIYDRTFEVLKKTYKNICFGMFYNYSYHISLLL